MRPCPQCAQSCDAAHQFCPGCGFPIGKVAINPDDPLLGTTLPGGFVILELIGVGGMGRVYRAEQTTLGRTVAVKIVHPHLVGEENAVARFITEARAASRLNHPNSVAVIDFEKSELCTKREVHDTDYMGLVASFAAKENTRGVALGLLRTMELGAATLAFGHVLKGPDHK